MLCIIFMMSSTTSSFATISAHECIYDIWISYEYTDYSEDQHEVKTLKNYACTVSSCPNEYSEVVSVSYEDHVFSEMKWSGLHHHKGLYHYGYYVSEGLSCKHSIGEWRSWACSGGSGGGTCILPYITLMI